MHLTENAAFWQAVGTVFLALVGMLAAEAKAYMAAHRVNAHAQAANAHQQTELAAAQTEFQHLTNAYAQWRQVLTPILAAGAQPFEAIAYRYLDQISAATGMPRDQLESIGLQAYHEIASQFKVPAQTQAQPQ